MQKIFVTRTQASLKGSLIDKPTSAGSTARPAQPRSRLMVEIEVLGAGDADHYMPLSSYTHACQCSRSYGIRDSREDLKGSIGHELRISAWLSNFFHNFV